MVKVTVRGTAKSIGVEFEKVSSWLATISSKTRESAETIGNSVKSIMARYQQLREKGFAEEDGTKVNVVAKALNEANIQIIDSQGQFRNFGTVTDELGKKWGTLDNRTKAYIATAMAG
jgi:TP901 family phage tail tape measure protein